MDDVSLKINAYIAAVEAAVPALQLRHSVLLESADIQSALEEVLEPKNGNPAYLLDYNLSSARIVELLREFDFRRHKPELLTEIAIDEPLIPNNVPRLLTEQTVKNRGEVWRIHKNDADPFPSSPHAHNLETGLVLHLGTGNLYNKKRALVGSIGCKALLVIRSKLTNIALPDTSCA